MRSDLELPTKQWVRALPASRMVFPDQYQNRLKYFIWKLYTPIHPLIRETVIALGFVKNEPRQDFILGTIAEGVTLQEFISHCIAQGYGNHFVAWRDRGQVVSLRYAENFVYQYHLRVFEDGEVRGHYEYTPECRPILHIKEIGLEDRREVFYRHLGDRLNRAEAK